MSAWIGLCLCLGLVICLVVAMRRSDRARKPAPKIKESAPKTPVLVMPADAPLLAPKDEAKGKVYPMRPRKARKKAKKARGGR